MLEQNVDCTIVEEGDEDACIMKSVVKTIREISYYTFLRVKSMSTKILKNIDNLEKVNSILLNNFDE